MLLGVRRGCLVAVGDMHSLECSSSFLKVAYTYDGNDDDEADDDQRKDSENGRGESLSPLDHRRGWSLGGAGRTGTTVTQ